MYDELVEKIKKGDVFFFAGAGISQDAGLPSAGRVLYETAKHTLPQEEQYQQANHAIIQDEHDYKIQPEVFYSALLSLTDKPNCTLFWESVSKTAFEGLTCSYAPSMSHQYIVQYAYRHGLPIFTVNFDTLFEEACKQLNLPYKVLVPSSNARNAKEGEAYLDSFISEKQVCIIKLHGSLEDEEGKHSLETLHLTMTQISCPNLEVVDFINRLCQTKHIVFLGYSGRDIDYFPHIRPAKDVKPYWLNPSLGKKEKVIIGKTAANASYINARQLDLRPSHLFSNLSNQTFIEQKLSEKEYQQLFEPLAQRFNKEIALNQHEKCLFHAMLSHRLSYYKYAYDLLLQLKKESYVHFNERQRVILLLHLAGNCHALSKFVSFSELSKELVNMTKGKKQFLAFYINGLCMKAEARRMLLVSLDGQVDYIETLKTLWYFLWVGLRISPSVYGYKNRFPYLKSEESRTLHVSIEHWIRFWAIVQGGVLSVTKKMPEKIGNSLKQVLINRWVSIRRKSVRFGYTDGIANAIKFGTRVSKVFHELIVMKDGKRIFKLSTSATGEELLNKNTADNFFEKAIAGDVPNPELLEKAKGKYEELYLGGKQSCNYLNGAKGLLGYAKCQGLLGNTPVLEQNKADDFAYFISQIEGEKWKQYLNAKHKEFIIQNLQHE